MDRDRQATAVFGTSWADPFDRADNPSVAVAAPRAWLERERAPTDAQIAQASLLIHDGWPLLLAPADLADQYAEARLVSRAQNSISWAGPGVRLSGTEQATSVDLLAVMGGTGPCTVVLARQQATSTPLASLGSRTVASCEGSVFRLEAVGVQLRAFQDDALILSATDGTYAAGRPGFKGFGTPVFQSEWRWAAWRGGPLW
jgi:hypothetical protein